MMKLGAAMATPPLHRERSVYLVESCPVKMGDWLNLEVCLEFGFVIRNQSMNTQDQLQFILGRRSIRLFKPGEVRETTIKELLQAAMAAPSAVAKDPWRFVVSQKPEMRASLATVLTNGDMLNTASLCITVCADLDTAHDRQLSYALQDCAAAIENLLLAAHALGLGACWLGVHPREDKIRKVKELLGLPTSVLPVACIAVGHPGEKKESRTRFNPAYVHREKW
jgi:nitroreductase